MSDAELATIKEAVGVSARSLDMFSVTQSISENVSMLEALYILAVDQRRALAVVDSTGAMRCEVSVTDLHLLTQASFTDLRLGVWEWLSRHSRKAMQPACVRIEATLGSVIALLALKRRHRLWVLDDKGVPTHVVSATDVLRALCPGSTSVDHRANSGDTEVSSLWRRWEDDSEDVAKKFAF
jgi:CBS-domain-containing membrane protein